MAKNSATITSLPPSLADDQRKRMISYSIMMIVRVVCIGLCLVVHGWWILVPALGAVFLPYFAVVVANAANKKSATVERPGFLLPTTPQRDARSTDETP